MKPVFLEAVMEPSVSKAQLLGGIDALEAAMKRAGNEQFSFAQVRDQNPDLARLMFTGRDLRRTILRDADLCHLDFRDSDLSGSKFDGARILGARFERAKVSRAALRKASDWTAYLRGWAPEDGPVHGPSRVRCPGERFSLSPHLPEMMLVPPEVITADLLPVEKQALRAGRLAIAIRPLTEHEFQKVNRGPGQNAAQTGATARHLNEPQTYCSELTEKVGHQFGLPPGTSVRLPGIGLCEALIRSGKGMNDSLGTDLDGASLRLAQFGNEFVVRQDGNSVELTRDRSNNLSCVPAGGQVALFRPIFIFGPEHG